jgi:hypothetical protein
MTITLPIRLFLARGLVAALALGGVGCTTYPSPPAKPAFDTDVLPIFQAHCTRCHGNGPDGGTLNAGGVPGSNEHPATATQPYLTQYGETCLPLSDGTPGTCQNNPKNCRCGAYDFAVDGMIEAYLDPNSLQPMPPPPAPPLNDWELKVVKAWVANPICSNSPNPDPTICPGP